MICTTCKQELQEPQGFYHLNPVCKTCGRVVPEDAPPAVYIEEMTGYKTGDWFRGPNGLYVLAALPSGQVYLCNFLTGNWYGCGELVGTQNNLTAEEWKRVARGRVKDFTHIGRIQCSS